MTINNQLTTEEEESLLQTLQKRFEENMERHESMDWEPIKSKLENNSEKLLVLYEMERTGGEPDVVSYDKANNTFTFFDCSKESPKGRRSTCYDLEGLESRKKHKPEHNAIDMAAEMGIEMLTEQQYRTLQELGEFDLKTSSWVQTPENIRKLGGALFCDRRYGHVFTYHNGASSYYSARGFRGSLQV